MKGNRGVIKVRAEDGSTPTSSMIDAANRAAGIYGQREHGIFHYFDAATGFLVQYIADTHRCIVSGGSSYSVSVAMPNPVPYRGISITADPRSLSNNYIVTSNGVTLANEPYVSTYDGTLWTAKYFSAHGSWNGGSDQWMFRATGPDNSYWPNWYYDHKLSFVVPEDCLYPDPSITPGYPGTDGLTAQWNTDWAIGVTAFNARRLAWNKKNSDEFLAALASGFKSGATGVTRTELQLGTLPASWDYLLKTSARTSQKTYQPTTAPLTIFKVTPDVYNNLIGSSYNNWIFALGGNAGALLPDVVVSDTSNVLTQSGIRVVKRSVVLSYTDVLGVLQTETIDGTCTQTVIYDSLGALQSLISVFKDWYSPWQPPMYVGYHYGYVFNWNFKAPFYMFNAPYYQIFFWNGTETTGASTNYLDSTWNQPTHNLSATYHVPYSNTLVGTAAPLYLQYHNSVKPSYHKTTPITTHDGSTVMNNSALYGITEIDLQLFGPVKADGTQLGLFASPTDADGCTQILYYGRAKLSFDWKTGKISVKSFHPNPTTATPPAVMTYAKFPTGVAYKNTSGILYFTGLKDPYGVAKPDIAAYNCVVDYAGATWPDVAAAVKIDLVNIKATYTYATTGVSPTSAGVPFGDPIRYMISKLK